MSNKRNRTPSEYIGYGLYLYFLGLSLRNVVKALSYLHIVKRSHVPIWKWIQKFRHRRISSTRRNKISEYIVDETILQVGPEYIWLWVAIDRARKRSNSRTRYNSREKHAHCRALSVRCC
jgi:putative transposase